MDERIHSTLRGAGPKPVKGAYLIERRLQRLERKDDEQRQMQEALVRDERQCRFCRAVPSDAPAKRLDLPIDPCHQTHRGMGGDPSGDRTTRQTVIALCRYHHGLWDRGERDIVPQDPAAWFDGCCDFYVQHPETGVMEHVASETTIGESVAVGA